MRAQLHSILFAILLASPFTNARAIKPRDVNVTGYVVDEGAKSQSYRRSPDFEFEALQSSSQKRSPSPVHKPKNVLKKITNLASRALNRDIAASTSEEKEFPKLILDRVNNTLKAIVVDTLEEAKTIDKKNAKKWLLSAAINGSSVNAVMKGDERRRNLLGVLNGQKGSNRTQYYKISNAPKGSNRTWYYGKAKKRQTLTVNINGTNVDAEISDDKRKRQDLSVIINGTEVTATITDDKKKRQDLSVVINGTDINASISNKKRRQNLSVVINGTDINASISDKKRRQSVSVVINGTEVSTTISGDKKRGVFDIRTNGTSTSKVYAKRSVDKEVKKERRLDYYDEAVNEAEVDYDVVSEKDEEDGSENFY